jgi:uncharacterized protein YdeI (YjbR/CyaY-like superfamily)
MVTKARNDSASTLEFCDIVKLQEWFEDHHGDPAGMWLKIARAKSGIDSVSHPQALEMALCYGWIDGQKKSLSDTHWLQKFTPRRAQSLWSKVNREKAEELIASKRMRPPGLAEVERAKADGRWDAAYDRQTDAAAPEDFLAAVAKHDNAREFFDSLDSHNRYAIVFRLQTAKRPETRARRIQQFAEMLARGESIYPQRGSKGKA